MSPEGQRNNALTASERNEGLIRAERSWQFVASEIFERDIIY